MKIQNLIAALLLLVSLGCGERARPQNVNLKNSQKVEYKPCLPWQSPDGRDPRLRACLDGSRISLPQSKCELTFPASWLEWHRKYGSAIQVSSEDLENVAIGHQNYFKDFASICNCLFPYDRCVASAGDAAWDSNAGMAIYFRVYVLDDPVENVARTVRGKGRAEILRITGNEGSLGESEYGDWRRVSVTFTWVEGTEDIHVENPTFSCFARRAQASSVVLCFWCTMSRQRQTMQQIVDSFTIIP